MSASNSSAIVEEVAFVRRSAIIFIQVWCYFLFVFGFTGHSLGIYVFTRRSLRSNPCSRYLLASTCSGLCVVLMNITLRFLQAVYNINIFLSSDACCRIISWLLVWARALTPWFLVVACIDRFLCSSASATVRSWSNLRVASRVIPLVVLLVGLAYVHVVRYVEITLQLQRCDTQHGFYMAFYGIWNLVIFGVAPSMLMLFFGLLTIRHLRRAARRILSTQNEPSAQYHYPKTTDRQLIRMLLFQCVFFALMAAPTAVNHVYFSVVSSTNLNVLDLAKNVLAGHVVNYLSLTGPSLSFYLCTLSSQLFRREVKLLFCGRHQALAMTGRNTQHLTSKT